MQFRSRTKVEKPQARNAEPGSRNAEPEGRNARKPSGRAMREPRSAKRTRPGRPSPESGEALPVDAHSHTART